MKKLYDAIKAVDTGKRFAIMLRQLSCVIETSENCTLDGGIEHGDAFIGEQEK